MANVKKTTTTKKTPAKSTRAKAAKITDQTIDMSVPSAIEEAPRRNMRVNKVAVYIVGGIFLLGLFVYFFKGWFVAAVVNGEPISRFSVTRELEKRGGNQILDGEVYKTLIFQEARKRNVSVTQKEIDEQAKKYEDAYAKEGKNFEQELKANSFSKEDYMEIYYTIPKLLEKMVAKDVKEPTSKEIADYIEKNKEALPKDQAEQELKNYVKESLKQSNVNEKIQLLLAELQKNAKVSKWISY